MISFPLFKQTLKSNYKFFIIFLLILTMYFSVIITMYDPANVESMQLLLQSLPKEVVNAMNFNLIGTTFTGFLASYLYGFLMIIFPMIYIIILANRLVAKHIDNGSMAYLLATPNSRKKVVFTQMIYFVTSIILLMVSLFVLSYIISEIAFPGLIDISIFVMLNLGVLLLHLAIGSIAFLSSCIFNDSKDSLAFGAGIPILFFLIQMLGNVGDKLSFLKNFTLFSLFNPQKILEGSASVPISFAVLFIIAVVLFTTGIVVFNKKDLPI
ncbi:MAG: ABC transporter permease subunit [Clostridiaceae bacterium]